MFRIVNLQIMKKNLNFYINIYTYGCFMYMDTYNIFI